MRTHFASTLLALCSALCLASAGAAAAPPVNTPVPDSGVVPVDVNADAHPQGSPPASVPAPVKPPPTLHHEPFGWATAGEPLRVTARWSTAPEIASDVLLHYRVLGQAGFTVVPFGMRDETTLEATIPAAEMRGDAVEYYVGSRPTGRRDGPEQLHFATPAWPHAVIVVVEDSERTTRALLAQHMGNHSQFRIHGMYIDRGLRTVISSDRTKQFDMRDYYYRLEGDYTYRMLSAVYSIRIGGGVLRGDTFSFEPQALVHVDNVGLTYGFAEVRFRFGRLVRMDLRATLGAGPSHFDGGAGGQLLIGLDPGTHFAVGVDGVSSVGVRAWVRLAWTTVPHVPMSFTLEASNLPLGADVGGLMYLTAGYRFSRYASFDLNLGYAHRDREVGGPITGLTLRFEF